MQGPPEPRFRGQEAKMPNDLQNRTGRTCESAFPKTINLFGVGSSVKKLQSEPEKKLTRLCYLFAADQK